MSSGEFIEICKEEVRKHNEQHMDKKRFRYKKIESCPLKQYSLLNLLGKCILTLFA